MENIIKQMLSPKRFEHSIGVAKTAECLAKKYGEVPEKAYLAGVAHDIAKELPKDKFFELCKKGNIELDPVEIANPALLHGPAGSVLIKDYGIDDEDIINAVRYHTVGREHMSRLEKIIYLADMIEPARSFREVDELRELAEHSLDLAVQKTVGYIIRLNMERGSLIHENSIKLWNEMVNEYRKAKII